MAIRFALGSTSVVADIVEQARTLEQTNITHVSDATTNVADAASSQTNLATSLSSLMDKVGILVKLGDEVAKVCPRLAYHYLYRPKIVVDTSLCQFRLAGAFSWVECGTHLLIPVFHPLMLD